MFAQKSCPTKLDPSTPTLMKKTAVALLTIVALTVGSPRLFALYVQWNGTAADSKLTSAGNWVGGVLPITSDDAFFTNNAAFTVPTTLEIDANMTVGGAQWARGFNGTGIMTLGNGTSSAVTLTLSSGTASPLIVNHTPSGTLTFNRRNRRY